MTDRKNNKRIAKNTLMLYIRMLITLIISLYTSRIVLSSLGVSDYGVYNVVGGFVSMFAFLNNSLTSATQRFLTFELGKGDNESIRQTFSTCLFTHGILAIVIFLIAESFGLWFLNNKLQLPSDRINAAFWVFQFSLISAIIMILSVPYNALIVAHEKMKAFAVIATIEAILKLLVAMSLSYVNYDKLIVYAFLILVIQVAQRLMYSYYSATHFTESKFSFRFNKDLSRQMLSFASWTIIGNGANILAMQGVNVLLNIFFGPVVNAARGVASQVQGALLGFVSSFQTALNPQIVKTYAQNQIGQHQSLVLGGSKYSMILMMFISLPFLFKTETILSLWLTEVPLHASNFLRLAFFISIFDASVNSSAISIGATGKVRANQLTTGMILLLIVPISYILLAKIKIPEIAYIVHLSVVFIAQIVRLQFVKRYINLQTSLFLKKVYLKCFVTFSVMLLLPFSINEFFENDLFSTITFFCVTYMYGIFVIYVIGLNKEERQFVLAFFKKRNVKYG